MVKTPPQRIDPDQLVERALAVLRADHVCYLATAEGDQPRLRPVSPLMGDRFAVYVANLSSYNKTREIAANPKVELCYLDKRHNQVRVTGVAEIMTDPATLKMIWERPQATLLRAYLETIDGQQFILYRIRPTRVRYMEEWAVEYYEVPLD